MTPQPAIAMHLTLDPATTDEALATIFGALRRDPERSPAQHQTQRDAGALMIAALHPNNPVEAAYAVRATAAHFASMECFRRTTIPDTPDNVGQRWFGKALALSRMSTDLIDVLTDCQEATPHARRQPAVRPDEGLSQALAAELARRQSAARAKAAGTPASPAAPDMRAGASAPERRDPKPSERRASAPAAPAIPARPAASPAAKLAEVPACPSPPDPRTGLSAPDRTDPLSSERPWVPPAASAIMSRPAAVSCLAPTLPRAGLRAGPLSSTSLSSGVVPVPAAAPVMPATLARS